MRQMNKVAHLLAKEGLGMEEYAYLRNDLPKSVAQAGEENRRDGRSAQLMSSSWNQGIIDHVIGKC